MLESLELNRWDAAKRAEAAKRPEGPRDYETFLAKETSRWLFAPRDVNVGYEAWPALDELFPTAYQGVNPNRGLDGSVLDTDREALAKRMNAYFSARDFSEAARLCPELAEKRARYEPEAVWKLLRASGGFGKGKIEPYLLFPLDLRWLYYEGEGKLLNEARRDFGENFRNNEFLVTVPQPRRRSEARPLLSKVLLDLHVHDRGSVCFPREVKAGPLVTGTQANLNLPAWRRLATDRGLSGALADQPARELVGRLFRCALAILHSPQYQEDHQDTLAQDWAHLPIPSDPAGFDRLVAAGDKVATLLDPSADADQVMAALVGADRVKHLGVVRRRSGGPVDATDLAVTVSYHGAAKGDWKPRAFSDEEQAPFEWGDNTGDLYINGEVYFANVPAAVWRFELGGYPTLKKWLGYRQANRRGGHPLTLAEAHHLRSMIQRLAALLTLHQQLDQLYGAASALSLTAEDLGLRT